METNEAFPDRETNPTDLDKLEPKKMRPGHCTKKSHPGSPGMTFWGPIHHPPLLEKYLTEGNCYS